MFHLQFFFLAFGVLLFSSVLTAESNCQEVDILIVAPHPDDEVIGCTGFIMQALESGKKVAVVVMTNGDGFPKGTSAITSKPREELEPSDFLKLATLRQNQSFDGIKVVGLQPTDLSFLSYPDGGLAAIYRSESHVPYRAKHTSKSTTYGLVVKDYHSAKHGSPANYTKESVLGDLTEIIKERKPEEIYVTHEVDQHPDHRAALWFVRDAAKDAKFQGKLFTYLVHGVRLPPGKPRRVKLTCQQLEAKKFAIGKHKIPTVHDHLVAAHAKEEELFWEIRLDQPSKTPSKN